jgi:hypothetical protein
VRGTAGDRLPISMSGLRGGEFSAVINQSGMFEAMLWVFSQLIVKLLRRRFGDLHPAHDLVHNPGAVSRK